MATKIVFKRPAYVVFDDSRGELLAFSEVANASNKLSLYFHWIPANFSFPTGGVGVGVGSDANNQALLVYQALVPLLGTDIIQAQDTLLINKNYDQVSGDLYHLNVPIFFAIENNKNYVYINGYYEFVVIGGRFSVIDFYEAANNKIYNIVNWEWTGNYFRIEVSESVIPDPSPVTVTNADILGMLSTSFVDVTFNVPFITPTFEIINPYNNIVDGKYIGWTLEPKYITVNGPIETDRYYQFNFTVTQQVGTVIKTETFKNKMPLFNGSNKINIGRVVHRLMERNLDLNNFFSDFTYYPATVDITVTRKKESDLSVIDFQTLQVVMYAGWDRAIDKQFLDYDCRLIADGGPFIDNYAILSAGNFVMNVYKNNVLIGSENIVGVGKTFYRYFSFNTLKAGDRMLYELTNTNNSNAVYKEIYVMPEGKYRHDIYFINDFNVKNQLTCTGSYKIQSETEYIQNKTYKNLVDHLENLTTIKETKLTINTGWLMLRDVACVEALLRSKYVMLLTNNGTYNLVPVQKQIVNRDLEQGLIEFGLEFIINRESDAAIYL